MPYRAFWFIIARATASSSSAGRCANTTTRACASSHTAITDAACARSATTTNRGQDTRGTSHCGGGTWRDGLPR